MANIGEAYKTEFEARKKVCDSTSRLVDLNDKQIATAKRKLLTTGTNQ
jgi:hypothetical protein